MMLLEIVNKLLAVATIGSQIFIILAIIYSFLPIRKNIVSAFFAENGIKLAFAVALVAVSGSLFYSNYVGFVPCVLCWYQRISMYPEVVILGLALLKKDNKILDYSLALSAIGLAFSFYHNYIYYLGLNSTVCTSAESCATPYVTEFGYITIPAMALTAFALIIVLLAYKKIYDREKI